MNIICNINDKLHRLVLAGLTDEEKVLKALSTALANNPTRNPNMILEQAYVALLHGYYNGSTEYVKGV